MDGVASLRLQACQSLDVTDGFTVPLATLTPSQYAHHICMHPSKPLLAVAAGTTLAVYDLITSTRLSRLDMRGTICEMSFSPDGVTLVMVMQEWMIFGWSLATARAHVLVPRREKADKPLEDCLLTVGGGPRAALFYCKYGKEAVRRATLTPGDVLDAKGRLARTKEGTWGAKMKLEPARPIVGLALPPHGGFLMVLHVDGAMRLYNTTGDVKEVFMPLVQVQVQDTVSKGLPPPGTLLVVPHPSSPSTTLIIQAARFASVVNVLQLQAGATSPTLLARARIPGGGVVLGAGILQDCQQVVAVVSSQPEGGRLRTMAWSMPGLDVDPANPDTASMQLVKVEPVELNPFLDPRASQQQLLQPSALAPPPPVNATFSPTPYANSANRYDAILGVNTPTQGAAKQASDGGAAVMGMLHSMWAPTSAWAASVSHAGTLAGGLTPVVSQVLIHSTLPVIAVQLQPSAYMKNTPAYMQLTLSGAAPDEYAQIRKLLSVPLIAASSWDSLLSAGADRAMVAQQRGSLQHWTPTTFSGPIQLEAATSLASPATPTKSGTVTASAASTTMQSKFRAAGTPHLTLPGVLYYVSDSALCKYSLVSKAQTTMISLPEGAVGNGAQRAVHSMAYSRAGAWLVFFETRGVAATSNDRWQWTVIHANDLTSPVWLKPGKYGAFIGPREEQFAVVDASGRLAAVFSLATCQQAGAAPDYLYSLEGLSANGVALPVFPGPPRDPVPDPAASAVIGCVMWQSTAGGLAARPLPALLDPETNKQGTGPSGVSGPAGPNPGYSTLGLTFSGDQDDSSSNGEYDTPRARDGPAEELGGESPAEPLGTGAVAPGSSLGPLGPKYWLPLQAGELVMQVSWQALTWEPSGADEAVAASTGAEGTGGKSRVKPGPAMAAVMTNQRILLVTELLHVHASVSLHEHMCGVLPSPASSILWAGPALMILLVDGRILQLTWGGTVHPVGSISGEKRAHLAGATPDALLLLRPVDSKKLGVASWEVVHRPMSMLQPLVLGWSTLGLLSSASAGTSAVAACRAVLRSLMEHSDPAPTTPGLIWALLGTCALDLGYALVSQNDTVEPRAYLAAAAAAGDWEAVERALALELERAAHHPAPPPAGSAGHCKLMAAAAGAVAHGQMKRAVNLLQMAGEWRLAMVIACASGDTSAVHQVAAKMSTSPTSQAQHEEAESAQRMASALRNLYNSSVTAVPDAKLQLVGPDGDACLPEPGAWLLGAPRATITARAEVVDVQSLREERGATIAPTSTDQLLMATLALDTATRVALNLRAASVSQDGTAPSARTSNAGGIPGGGGALVTSPSTASTVAGTTPSKDPMGPLTDNFGLPINAVPPPMPLASGGGSALDDIFGLDLMVSRTHTAKDEFASMGTRSDGSNSDSDLSITPSPAQQWKGKVTIRDKASAPTLASNPDQLRDAMKSLRLGAPGAPPLASGNLMTGFSGSFNTSSPSFQGAGAGQFSGLSPALAAGMQHPPPQPLQPGSSFSDLPPPLIPGVSHQQQQQQPAGSFQGLSPALASGMQPPAGGSFQGLSPALAAGMQQQQQPQQQATGSFQGLSPALAAGMVPATQPANPFAQAPPAQPQAPWPSQQATTGAFQGLSPALATGMNPPAQPQQPAAGSSQGLSPALTAGMQQQQPQQPATGSFQGLSPALAAGMTPQPQPAAQTAAFQGLSPALAAGMSQQQPAAAPAAAFKGLSSAPAAGMTTQPQPQAAAAAGPFQGLSPALAAGMTKATQQPAPAPAASFRGLSPALAAGMTQPAQPPPATNTFQGLSPALAAGMVQQPAKPAQPAAPAASTFAGLSPALAAGMSQTNQQASAAPSAAFKGLSPALAAGMVQQAQQPVSSSFQGLSPALAAGMVGTAARPPPAAAQPAAAPVGNPDTLYHEGVMQLEQGAWAAADERFSQALVAISQLPQDETTRSKAAYCSQYLCAVQLLNLAAAGNGPNEARLYRYAAALDLDPRHRTALTKESVARNKQQRNFKYCGDALTWLVTSLLSGPVSDSVLQPLQEAIDACEKAGNRDAAVPKGENLEAFARASAGCRTREDVSRLLAPVLSAK